jgi:hypothetical protein
MFVTKLQLLQLEAIKTTFLLLTLSLQLKELLVEYRENLSSSLNRLEGQSLIMSAGMV